MAITPSKAQIEAAGLEYVEPTEIVADTGPKALNLLAQAVVDLMAKPATIDGDIPIFATVAEMEAYMAANPGKQALTLEPTTPDTTPPTPGVLGVIPSDKSASLTVSGEWDDRAVTGYAFQTNGGAWSAWQSGNTKTATGLTPNTDYTFTHKVRDRAGNEAVGGPVVTRTLSAPTVRRAPDEISGLIEWWDASDTSTITTDGSSVTAWASKSNPDHVMKVMETSVAPITVGQVSGLPALRFGNGGVSALSQDVDNVPAAVAPLTYWGVARVDDFSHAIEIVGQRGGMVGINPASRELILQGSTARLFVEQGQLMFFAIETNSGAQARSRVNSVEGTHTINRAGTFNRAAAGATIKTTGETIGWLDGYLCEFGAHSGIMSDTDWGALWAYMAQKWSIGA